MNQKNRSGKQPAKQIKKSPALGGAVSRKAENLGTVRKQTRSTPNRSLSRIQEKSGGPSLPHSSMAKPLHVKKPRGTQDGRLKSKSPWYQSIIDPAQGAGIKMPDDNGIVTGTLQCCLEEFITVNAAGIGGLRTMSLLPNLAGLGNTSAANYQKMTSTSTPVAVAWNQAVEFPTNTSLVGFSKGVRVVSAGIYCESEASLASAEGEMILGYNAYAVNSSALIESFRNNFGSSIMPINRQDGMMVHWIPVSIAQNVYEAFSRPQDTTLGPGDPQCPEWSLYVLVSGAAVGSVVRVRLVVNYEFIPLTNTIDIVSANPSPVDQMEVELVEAWVADTPPARPVTTREMSLAPGAEIESKIPQDGGPTGFGLFADVVAEILPYALEGLSMFL